MSFRIPKTLQMERVGGTGGKEPRCQRDTSQGGRAETKCKSRRDLSKDNLLGGRDKFGRNNKKWDYS